MGRWLSDILGDCGLSVATKAGCFAAGNRCGSDRVAERCGDLRELDRMINADRARIDGYDFASAEGPIVLAWLAGNPNFESMVAYADTRYDRGDIEGDTPIVQLADHLRRTVPVGRR